MPTGVPTSASQVEARIKADVQREAPDANPYATVSWLRSLIAGIAFRIFDFYLDLRRTEVRLMPDTADDTTALRWGGVFIGPPTPASVSSGELIVTGNLGAVLPTGTALTAGEQAYTTTASVTVVAQTVAVSLLTRTGQTATATTDTPHGLSSFTPVTIVGANEFGYNLVDVSITVTGLSTFEYQVPSGPPTPATGSIQAEFVGVGVPVLSAGFGAAANLAGDTAVALQSPAVGIDSTLYVTFGAVGGGTDSETTAAYKRRYLDRIRDPVAHFNDSDIETQARTVAGVTRVFVKRAGTAIGTFAVSGITRNGNIATATTPAAHGLVDGQAVTISGAGEPDYNVIDARVIIDTATTFSYVALNSPATPATGTISSTSSVAAGQVITYFTRDNDPAIIPDASEVQAVKDAVDEILPATTSSANNLVLAPVAQPVAFTFTAITPDTPTMRLAVEANLQQFFAEAVDVGTDVPAEAYRAAIKNTVDTENGDLVLSFVLSAPAGDVAVAGGALTTQGAVTWP